MENNKEISSLSALFSSVSNDQSPYHGSITERINAAFAAANAHCRKPRFEEIKTGESIWSKFWKMLGR